MSRQVFVWKGRLVNLRVGRRGDIVGEIEFSDGTRIAVPSRVRLRRGMQGLGVRVFSRYPDGMLTFFIDGEPTPLPGPAGSAASTPVHEGNPPSSVRLPNRRALLKHRLWPLVIQLREHRRREHDSALLKARMWPLLDRREREALAAVLPACTEDRDATEACARLFDLAVHDGAGPRRLGETVQRLRDLARRPLLPGLDRWCLLRELICEIVGRRGSWLGLRRATEAAAIHAYIVLTCPAEYVRLVTGLASPRGRILM